MAPPPGRCPSCGFAPATVSPSDAAVAARTYPRRFRALLVRPDEDDPEIVHRVPASGGPSAAGHAALAAVAMAAAAEGLRRIRAHEGADVGHLADPAAGDGPGRPEAGPVRTLDEVLASLAGAATALADAVDAVHGEDWARAGLTSDGTALTALDVARLGVHAGIHHLRAAERVLDEVRWP